MALLFLAFAYLLWNYSKVTSAYALVPLKITKNIFLSAPLHQGSERSKQLLYYQDDWSPIAAHHPTTVQAVHTFTGKF